MSSRTLKEPWTPYLPQSLSGMLPLGSIRSRYSSEKPFIFIPDTDTSSSSFLEMAEGGRETTGVSAGYVQGWWSKVGGEEWVQVVEALLSSQ